MIAVVKVALICSIIIGIFAYWLDKSTDLTKEYDYNGLLEMVDKIVNSDIVHGVIYPDGSGEVHIGMDSKPVVLNNVTLKWDNFEEFQSIYIYVEKIFSNLKKYE